MDKYIGFDIDFFINTPKKQNFVDSTIVLSEISDYF